MEQITAEKHRLRILTYTSLFPNQNQPLRGIFILQRVGHLGSRQGNCSTVIAPVPYTPSWLPSKRLRSLAAVPERESIEQLTVYHPRYLLVPKVSMPLHGWLMFLGTLGLARRLHREVKFDCIDAHYVYPDGFAAVLLGKVLHLPVIVSARGTDINLFPRFRTIRPMIRWTLREAAGIVAVSGQLERTMINLGASPDKIRVIGNGVDTRRFHPVDRGEARQRLGLPANAEVIVSVGALVPYKGFQSLIRAIAELAPRHPNLRLRIIGEGAFRSALERLIREYGVQERVALVGNRPNEELKYWFSAADFSCLLSSREGQPNVVLESLACGTPVIATRVGGIPEVLASDELGFLVDNDSKKIISAMELAFQGSWDRALIAERAARRTWENVASEMEDFLILHARRVPKIRADCD